MSETVKLDGQTMKDKSYWTFYTIEANPNVVYQKTVANLRNGSFDLYGGGGVSLGMAQTTFSLGQAPFCGKFGINAALGMEFVFRKFILGLDFKPGYGLAFSDKYWKVTNVFFDDEVSWVKVDSHTLNVFDWSVGMTFKWSL